MNKKDEMMQVNHNKNLFEFSDRSKTNCVRLSTGNTALHEFAKWSLCWLLQARGEKFLTEPRFLKSQAKGRDRPDVVSLTTGKAYEIAVSEEEASLAKKKNKWPLEVVVIRPVLTEGHISCRLDGFE